jgi:hypothetical protein
MRRWEEPPVPLVAFAELVRGGTGLGGWKGAEFMIVDGEGDGGVGRQKEVGSYLRYV